MFSPVDIDNIQYLLWCMNIDSCYDSEMQTRVQNRLISLKRGGGDFELDELEYIQECLKSPFADGYCANRYYWNGIKIKIVKIITRVKVLERLRPRKPFLNKNDLQV